MSQHEEPILPLTTLEGVALTSTFGIPPCMLDLLPAALALIPSPILIAIRDAIKKAEEWSLSAIRKIQNTVRDILGLSWFPDRDGFYSVFSDFSRFGIDLLSTIAGALVAFMKVLEELLEFIEEIQSLIASPKYRKRRATDGHYLSQNIVEYTGKSATDKLVRLINEPKPQH